MHRAIVIRGETTMDSADNSASPEEIEAEVEEKEVEVVEAEEEMESMAEIITEAAEIITEAAEKASIEITHIKKVKMVQMTLIMPVVKLKATEGSTEEEAHTEVGPEEPEVELVILVTEVNVELLEVDAEAIPTNIKKKLNTSQPTSKMLKVKKNT